MHPIPRFFIMLVIAIAGLGFMYRSSSVYPKNASNRSTLPPQVIKPEQTTDPFNPLSQLMDPKSSESTKLDLVGPWICEYKADDMQAVVKVFQKNASIKLIQEKVETRIVLKDGILFRWEQGSSKGIKITGLGQYVSMIEMFSSFLTSDMIFSALPAVVESGTISREQITALKDSCTKKEVTADAFKIPTTVTFEETTVEKMKQEVPE